MNAIRYRETVFIIRFVYNLDARRTAAWTTLQMMRNRTFETTATPVYSPLVLCRAGTWNLLLGCWLTRSVGYGHFGGIWVHDRYSGIFYVLSFSFWWEVLNHVPERMADREAVCGVWWVKRGKRKFKKIGGESKHRSPLCSLCHWMQWSLEERERESDVVSWFLSFPSSALLSFSFTSLHCRSKS